MLLTFAIFRTRYTTDGEAIGAYAEAVAGEMGQAFGFLRGFLQAAFFCGYMPGWWSIVHRNEVLSLACDGTFSVKRAQEVFDVRIRWGYRTTKVLRTLGHCVRETMWNEDTGCRVRFFDNESRTRRMCSVCYQEKFRLAFVEGQWRKDDRKCNACSDVDMSRRVATSNGPSDGLMVTGDGFSRVSLMDHLVEISGGGEEFKTITYLYMSCLSHPMMQPYISAAKVIQHQKKLKEKSDAGDPMAQYLWGKCLKCDNVVVLGKTGAQFNAALKVWTLSARSGNAYAMAGLGLMHRDALEQPTAIHWWNRALALTAMPEAAYNIGVSFGLGQNGTPIDYSRAAIYYSRVVDIDLKDYSDSLLSAKAFDSEDITKEIANQLLELGPNNDDQEGYQKLAKKNLSFVEGCLARPETARYAASSQSSPEVAFTGDAASNQSSAEDASTGDEASACATCQRRPGLGEKKLRSCSKCQKAKYCNSLCQKGHWSEHKMEECSK
jgi:hypothetical protein